MANWENKLFMLWKTANKIRHDGLGKERWNNWLVFKFLVNSAFIILKSASQPIN